MLLTPAFETRPSGVMTQLVAMILLAIETCWYPSATARGLGGGVVFTQSLLTCGSKTRVGLLGATEGLELPALDDESLSMLLLYLP